MYENRLKLTDTCSNIQLLQFSEGKYQRGRLIVCLSCLFLPLFPIYIFIGFWNCLNKCGIFYFQFYQNKMHKNF